jgi:acyl-coenzyme A thioesterase PaaI-like protein
MKTPRVSLNRPTRDRAPWARALQETAMALNRMAKSLKPLERVPTPLRARLRSMIMGRIVPFVGTAGLSIDELTDSRAVVSIRNRRPVRNHIGGVHAAAMALLAETASGFVVGMNVPDDRVPVIKSLHVDFRKRSHGGMRALAVLTPEQLELLRTAEKGEVDVGVTVTDEDGKQPIECRMIWAWTPKRR